MSVSNKWTTLYKALQKEAANFESYSYRNFFKRRIDDYWHKFEHETDPAKLNSLYIKGEEQLAVLKRQSIIDRMYKGSKLVIENPTLK